MPPGPPPPPKPGTGSKNGVGIYFNNSGIHDITGPTPFITINRDIDRTSAGEIQNIKTSINLEGKIVKTSGQPSGINGVFSAIESLKGLFTKCDNADLDIKCGETLLSKFPKAKLISFNADKSSDNWVFTADYNIQLEIIESGKSGEPPVTNSSDSWSIEPIEDYLYFNWSSGVSKKPEGVENTRISALGGTNFNFTNLPQFRISHRVSAVGLSGSTLQSGNNTVCPSSSDPNKAYLTAKDWVQKRLSFPFSNSGAYITGSQTGAGLPSGSGIALFNHIRSINFSLTEGSYEVVDNWLALPSGVRYTEEFSMESSTSDNFTTTVRVQGTVKGLETETVEVLKTGLTPDKSGQIGLEYGNSCGTGALSSAGGGGTAAPSSTGTLKCYKYENALDGWLEDIKPTLYTRACSLVNSRDRTQPYVNPAARNPPTAPINPIFAKLGLLSVIPVSTTEGHSPINGTISYSYEYNNKFNAISGTISENITITDEAPTDVVAETFVLGRQLGPVLQKMGKTSCKKSVTIEVVTVPPSDLSHFPQTSTNCPLYTGGYIFQTINCIVEGLKPFGDRVCSVWSQQRSNNPGIVYLNSDTRNWNPVEGRFSRSVSWTYQRCTIGDWMQH